jgi:hypothetical protein
MMRSREHTRWPRELIAFLLLTLLLTDAAAQSDMEKKSSNNSILFRTRQPLCRMYAASCDMSVLIRKRIDLTTLEFVSSSQDVFQVQSIEVCNDTQLCNYSQFSVNESVFNENKYIYYRIEITPQLIGDADILIKHKETSIDMAARNFVVVKPRRLIDMIFDVWIYVFGTFISLIMGILLDRASLVKIIKMPKAIGIGFCCQYLMMPLVSSFFVVVDYF